MAAKTVLTITLTLPEINHLWSLIQTNEREGCYYAPKDQYWARSERIKKKLGVPGGMETTNESEQ